MTFEPYQFLFIFTIGAITGAAIFYCGVLHGRAQSKTIHYKAPR